MTRQRFADLGLYGLYAGAGIILVAFVASLLQRGGMSAPVYYGMLVGVALVVISFFTSGAVSARQAKYGSNMLLMVVALGAILSFSYYLLNRYPHRIDLTKQGLFTLSDQTIKILQELKAPVRAVAFMTPGQSDEYGSVEELLKGYALHTEQFKAEFVDPYVDPVRARDMKVQELGTVVFMVGEGAEQKKFSVTKSDYVEYDYSGAQMGQPPTSSFKGEQAFTTALLNVTGGEKKKIYFLAGHEEEPLSGEDRGSLSHFKDALESEGYTTEQLHLSKVQQVPQDASVLVIAGPKRPLMPAEAQILSNYVKGGGKALVLPNLIGAPNLNDVLGPFGLKVGDDVVIDPQSRSLLSPYVTVAAAYEYHEITDKMTAYTIFTASRSISSEGVKEPWKATPLIRTSEAAWGETDPQRPRFDEGADRRGPLELMVLVEGAASDVPAEVKPEGPVPQLGFGEVEMPAPAATPPAGGQGGGNAEVPTPSTPAEGADPAAAAAETGAAAAVPAEKPATLRWSDQGRLAVIGSSAVIGNENFLEGGNRDLALNTINWLVGKRELISIRSKDTHLPQLTMTEAETENVKWIAIVFVPALILILGISVWYQRR